MPTLNIETTSTSKEWVEAAKENESVQLLAFKYDISFIQSSTKPITQTEENNFKILKDTPFDISNNETDKLWVFIDNTNKLRKRSIPDLTVNADNSDFSGNSSMNTVIGEQITGEKTDNLNVMFEYPNSDYDVIKTESGTGTLTYSNSKAILGTGTGVGKYVLKSKEFIRYVTGHEVNEEMTVKFDNPELGVRQIAGIGDANDLSNGFSGIGYDEASNNFGSWVTTIDDGLAHIPQSEWNVDKLDGTGASGVSINPQALILYKQTYGWYGILPIKQSLFFAPLADYIHFNTIEASSDINPHLPNPTQRVSCSVERFSGTGSDIKLHTASWRGGIVGKVGASSLIDRIFMIKTVKSINGVNVPVVSIRNPLTFQGKTNNVKVRLGTFTPISDGTKSVEFDVYSEGILTGGTWIAQDPNNSVTEYNNTATSFVPTVDLVGGTGLAKVDRDRINLVKGDVILNIYPGEEKHVVSSSDSNSDIILYLRRIEEF